MMKDMILMKMVYLESGFVNGGIHLWKV
jgi:hypothetical protein